MPITDEQRKQSQADFASAFQEDAQPAPEQSEDEAFGITPETDDAPEGAAADPAGDEAAAGDPAAGPAADGAPAEAAAEVGPDAQTPLEGEGEPAGADAGDGEVRDAADIGAADDVPPEGVDVEKERQRLKSWEGRLKKLQAELDAKGSSTVETPAADAIEKVGEQAESEGDPALGKAADDAAEKVESGELTAEQAMKQLAEDFGEDFVRMIEAIASAKAHEAGSSAASAKVDEVNKSIDEIISNISDERAQRHFEQIASKHPDFREVGKSEGFRQYIDALSPEQKADAERVVSGGSAKEIIALLDGYQAAQPQGEGEAAADEPAADPVVDDEQIDAAEGVRSSGMKLPDEPKPAADSFEDAWKEF